MRCALAVVVVVGCGSGSAPRRPDAPPPRIAAVDAIAEVAVREGGAVGLSIVVMRGERIVHAAGYGFEDLEHQVPATDHSVYLLASLSKQFWAVGLAQLVEQNRLSVDAPLADVLPGFPDRRVTIRHLLTQTSGLGGDRVEDDNARFTDVEVAFAPGTRWHYSNRGAILVRHVVERIANARWDAYLAEHIAKPLQLSSVETCDAAHAPVMYGADRQRVTEPADKYATIQFVCANARDVARFERSLDRGALLRPETVAAMRTRTEVAGIALPYGWLTRIADLDGHRAYGHTGTGDGTSIAAFRFPDDDLTIVVLENTAPRPGNRAYELVARVARELLHVPAPQLHDRPLTSEELADIVGAYVEGPARAEISAREGHAYLTLRVADRTVWEGALVTAGDRQLAGGPEGATPDALATFVPARGRATAILVGHRFLLETMFRRE